jgi:DNA-binding NtrC family response regulator
LLDIVMPGIDGYETCRRLKEDPETREAAVIFLSSLDETKDKVRGLEVGAVDFVSKPFQSDEVVARVNTHVTIQRLRRQLEARNAELARELMVAQELLTDARRRVEGPLLGDSPAIRALRESMARYAADAEVLLLTGPQGAGHEAAARTIHHASPRSRQAFIHVNCTLLPPGQDPGILRPPVTASEPGSVSRLSLLELATHGTLYLEEIQRLPGEVQGRLAEVLENVEAMREGGQPPVPDVHVLAYSSAPLATSSGFHKKPLALLGTQAAAGPVARRAPRRRRGDCPLLPAPARTPDWRRGRNDFRAVDEATAKVPLAGDVGELQNLIERAVTLHGSLCWRLTRRSSTRDCRLACIA